MRYRTFISDLPYVQERPAYIFVQDAGLNGRGWPFGHLEFFWKNATKTRAGAA